MPNCILPTLSNTIFSPGLSLDILSFKFTKAILEALITPGFCAGCCPGCVPGAPAGAGAGVGAGCDCVGYGFFPANVSKIWSINLLALLYLVLPSGS